MSRWAAWLRLQRDDFAAARQRSDGSDAGRLACQRRGGRSVCGRLSRSRSASATRCLISVALCMLWSDVPWRERLGAFWTWRKLWMIPVAAGAVRPGCMEATARRRLCGVCGVACSFRSCWSPSRPLADRGHGAGAVRCCAITARSRWHLRLPRSWRSAGARTGARAEVALGRGGGGGAVRVEHGVRHAGAQRLPRARGDARSAGRVQSARLASVALVATVLAAILAGAMALSPLARDRIDSAISEWRNASTTDRIKTPMGIRASALREHAGTGPGATLVRHRHRWLRRAYAAHMKDKYADWRVLPTVDPHNQYLFFLAEQGIFGLLAFLAFIVLALADRGDDARPHHRGWHAAGWCATSLLSSHFQTFSEGHLLAFFLGAMLARPVTGPHAPLPRRAPDDVGVTTVLVRLPNHVGDACMALPAMHALTCCGLDCALVGQGVGRQPVRRSVPAYQPIDGQPSARSLRSVRASAPKRRRRCRADSCCRIRSDRRCCLPGGVPERGPCHWRVVACCCAGRVRSRTVVHEVERFHAAACGALVAWGSPDGCRVPDTLWIASDCRRSAALRDGIAAWHASGALRIARSGGHGPASWPREALDAFRRADAPLRERGLQAVAAPPADEADAVRAALPGATLLPPVRSGCLCGAGRRSSGRRSPTTQVRATSPQRSVRARSRSSA